MPPRRLLYALEFDGAHAALTNFAMPLRITRRARSDTLEPIVRRAHSVSVALLRQLKCFALHEAECFTQHGLELRQRAPPRSVWPPVESMPLVPVRQDVVPALFQPSRELGSITPELRAPQAVQASRVIHDRKRLARPVLQHVSLYEIQAYPRSLCLLLREMKRPRDEIDPCYFPPESGHLYAMRPCAAADVERSRSSTLSRDL